MTDTSLIRVQHLKKHFPVTKGLIWMKTIGWVKAVLSANTCWQEHAGLVRSFIGFVASMTKRPHEVLRRCVPDMLGFTCV